MFEKQSNLQVANYMNGGHYNPHHDYVMKEKNPEHVSCECDLINLIFPTPDCGCKLFTINCSVDILAREQPVYWGPGRYMDVLHV